MASLRTGTYGSYYGSEAGTSRALSTSEMQVNATYIYAALTAAGWSTNAIAALLGNMQAESSINPGRWQSDDVGNMSMGFGLVQWTPATKYIEWVSGDYTTMDNNLSRITYETQNNLQWIATSAYPMSFKEFTTSSEAPSELAKAFLLNYERPADQSASVQSYRGGLADNWYTYISGSEPPNPSVPSGPSAYSQRKKRYNFVLFNRQRLQGRR